MWRVQPEYQLPSRKHLSTTLLDAKYKKIDDQLRSDLSTASSVSLTVDLWSNRQMRGYFGVTAHYIRPNWKLQHVMLACHRFRGSHTADHIYQQYIELTEERYNLSGKIAYVVTDNAANMKKAFSLPGFVTTDNPAESDSDNDKESGDEDNSQQQTMDTISILPSHLPCFIHTLQLCVHDGLKQAGALAHTIGKISKIVASVRKSTLASDILENECRLQQACPTRWNSQLSQIRSILAVSEDKLTAACKAHILTKYERNLLEDLVCILSPFEAATKMTQQEKISVLKFCYALYSWPADQGG